MHVPDSNRLRFELLQPPARAEQLLELDSDPQVMRYITHGKTSTLKEILAISMPRIEKYRNPDQGWGIWMVYEKQSAEFLGWILVRPVDFFSNARDDTNLELGWRFKSSTWGNGYATEAASAVMDALVENGNRAFTAIALPENLASISVMKKIGMTFWKNDTPNDPMIDEELAYYRRAF